MTTVTLLARPHDPRDPFEIVRRKIALVRCGSIEGRQLQRLRGPPLQLPDDNLAAAELTLAPEEIAKLDEASALTVEYPGWMLARTASGRVPETKA